MSSAIEDSELKQRHRAMWASGDYPSMVETFLLPLGPRLVDACGIDAGMRVLDVAAGTGNASLPAAQRGAQVTASDLTPELLEAGRLRAAAGSEALPVPAATSRTRCPSRTPHASTSLGPRGSRKVSTIRG